MVEYGVDIVWVVFVVLSEWVDVLMCLELFDLFDGCWEVVDYFDNDGIDLEFLLIKVVLEIFGDWMVLDFVGMVLCCVGLVNIVLLILVVMVYVVIKYVFLMLLVNFGVMCLIEVCILDNSFLFVEFLVFIGGYIEIILCMIDVIFCVVV